MKWLRHPARTPENGDIRERVVFAWWPISSYLTTHWLEWVRVCERYLVSYGESRWYIYESETWDAPGRRPLPPLERFDPADRGTE